jgi:hypothetical protein
MAKMIEFRSKHGNLMLPLWNEKLELIRTVSFSSGVLFATEAEAAILMKHREYGRTFHREGDREVSFMAPQIPPVTIVDGPSPAPPTPEQEFKENFGGTKQEYEPPANQIHVETAEEEVARLAKTEPVPVTAPAESLVPKVVKQPRKPRTE